MKRVLLWVARHGSTLDSAKNIFRGQRDFPLDEKGFNDAYELKEFFEAKTWDKIFTSDLKRGVQTAQVIASDRDDAICQPAKILRPWQIGYLTGKDKKVYGKDMDVFIKNPHMVPQDGECRYDFEHERVIPAFTQLIERGLEKEIPSIEVGHSSLIHALSHMLYGEGKNEKPLAVEPGGVIEVYLENGEILADVVFKKGKDDSSYAAGGTS